MKLKEGDAVLVTGPSHYEKAKVIKVEKNKVTLDNQMVITHDYENIVKTQMKAEPWDQEKYDQLHASAFFDSNLRTLLRYKADLPKDAIVTINAKVEKWLNKFNLKRI